MSVFEKAVHPLRVIQSVKTDHPCIPGHFPEQPIIPAVVLMDCIFEQFEQHHPELRCESMSKLKFFAPLVPDKEFVINAQKGESGYWKVSIHCQNEKCFSGRFKMLAK